MTDFYLTPIQYICDDGTTDINSASVLPNYASGYFVDFIDEVYYSYDGIIIPANESRSVMQVLGQYGNLSAARTGAHHIDSIPAEIFTRFTDIDHLVNWNLCGITVGVEDMQTAYCTTPSYVTMTLGHPAAKFFVNNQLVTVTDGKVTVEISNGENIFATQLYTCTPSPVSFSFKVVTANLSVAVDTTGKLPVASATGGFGSYKYSWEFGSGDFNNAFGAQATVTVEDAEGCTASKEVNIPTLQQNTPVASPVAATPQKKTSSASRLIGSLIGLTAAIIVM